MENTFSSELLGYCLRGEPWPTELLHAALAEPEFFPVVVEGLADRFEPALCDAYARLMAEALGDAHLYHRYQRIRPVRPFRGADPPLVFVLSRVTLGADVAITSVLLDAAKRRFPKARIVFAGPFKNWELFAGDPRLSHLPVEYTRGSLRDRLAHWPRLRDTLRQPDGIVIDPDTRLTQLGLLPGGAEHNYYFFESRGYGADTDLALPELAARWAQETFGVAAGPYLKPNPQPPTPGPPITVSLGVGGNPAKRIPDPFEEELLRFLGSVAIDAGAGGEETERVERAVARAGVPAHIWRGSFAGFASLIARSRLYVGYDSAGQHVAAACGVPLVCVFSGQVSPRMFARWRPTGSGPIEIVRVVHPDPRRILAETMAAVRRLA